MAFITIHFYSNSLRRNVQANALIPNDIPEAWRLNNAYYDQPMKAVYLLPGYEGSQMDWVLNAHLQVISQAYHLAVITPCGENSFYVDREGTGFKYGTYVGQELVAYTRKLFGLSSKREDTFIGGYSMGGFGALRAGLKYPATFSKVVALSSALIIDKIAAISPGFQDDLADYEYYRTVFGNLKELEASDKNPMALADHLLKTGQTIPDIYMACGMEDFLVGENRKLAAHFKENNMPLTYEEGHGEHNWEFWETYMEKGIKWLMADNK